ncbi:MAG: FG-GAP repeat domain-containing protein, partial [Akkermansiaceae bacterium]
YQNNNGIFTDVAAIAGVEDKAAGMSVGWSDVNQDGHMDLYISNMFSNAGNRITYQNQFKVGDKPGDTAAFQRFARGNTMFQNLGNGQFADISEPAGVTMARWAWGSVFADFNNDSLDDIIVANGFITSTDSGDL